MGFIVSSRTDDPTAIDDLIDREGNGARRSSRVAGAAIGMDAFTVGSRSDSASRWHIIFEGYLQDDMILARDLDLPPGAAKRQPADLVAKLLEREDVKGLQRLAGCYALVALDAVRQRILATRDRCGGRTLYYHADRGILTLASRSAWVVKAARLSARSDPSFITAMLALSSAPQAGSTAFKGVQELLPGEVLEFKQGRAQRSRAPLAWSSNFDYSRPSDCAEHFLELLQAAVETTLPDQGPVSCMLSGGLDSGPIAVLADRALAERDRSLKIASWTLPEYPDADESKWIEETASVLRSTASLIDRSRDLPFGRLDDSLLCPDLPLYNAFRPLVNGCYQLAGEQGARVILNGNAGDEIYAPRHLLNLDRARRGQWRLIRQDLISTLRQIGLAGLFRDPAISHPIARSLGLSQRRKAKPPAWLTAGAKAEWQPMESWPPEIDALGFPEMGQRLFGLSMAFGRAHEVAMAQRFGVDRRDPFQNEALLHFMLNAPMELSWRNGASKSIMRRAMRGLLPDPIRGKSRTGLLDRFFHAGLSKYSKDLYKLLFQTHTDWQEWVRPDAIRGALEDQGRYPRVLIAHCVGHALWQRYWS